MSLVILDRGRWHDWLNLPLRPTPACFRETPNPRNRCPWCGCREQYTDPRGHCPQCWLPWDLRDWLPHDFDRAEDLLESPKAS